MIRKILIANRGEIAVRVARTCKRLGIPTATVHSSADRFSRHVREIGESIELGPPPASQSYLDIAGVIQAARTVGADAIHPGYGFLSENANAARAVEDAGLIWIGPRSETIDQFGDKAKSKVLAEAAGVPVIPGIDGTFSDPAEIAEAAKRVGLPVLLKAAAGGGGKGMRLVETLDGIDQAIAAAMSEAQRSFGNGELMVERYLVDARHIEVQIAGDGAGNVVHFYERECSLQRRHQKIVEEAPANNLPAHMRQRMLEAACALGRHVSYRGIGTVELIATGHEFFFLEVNPRIQVEHPVSEQITGVDLVELQIRIANGLGLGLEQADIQPHGHAIEARLYAEDPDHGFLPVVGRVDTLDLPDRPSAKQAFRAECSIDAGDEVTSHYDPMIAKLVVWGETRSQALAEMSAVLDASHVGGLTTNIAFLRNLLSMPAIVEGTYHTRFVENSLIAPADQPAPEIWAVAAALWLRAQRAAGTDGPWGNWQSSQGWRLATGLPVSTVAPVAVMTCGDTQRHVRSYPMQPDGAIRLDVDDQTIEVLIRDMDAGKCVAAVGSLSILVKHRVTTEAVFVSSGGFEVEFRTQGFLETISTGAGTSDKALTAPMTGLVVRVPVHVGAQVEAGDEIAVIESMKLEHAIVAHSAGIVVAVHCTPDMVVERGTIVAEIELQGDD